MNKFLKAFGITCVISSCISGIIYLFLMFCIYLIDNGITFMQFVIGFDVSMSLIISLVYCIVDNAVNKEELSNDN